MDRPAAAWRVAVSAGPVRRGPGGPCQRAGKEAAGPAGHGGGCPRHPRAFAAGPGRADSRRGLGRSVRSGAAGPGPAGPGAAGDPAAGLRRRADTRAGSEASSSAAGRFSFGEELQQVAKLCGEDLRVPLRAPAERVVGWGGSFRPGYRVTCPPEGEQRGGGLECGQAGHGRALASEWNSDGREMGKHA